MDVLLLLYFTTKCCNLIYAILAPCFGLISGHPCDVPFIFAMRFIFMLCISLYYVYVLDFYNNYSPPKMHVHEMTSVLFILPVLDCVV